MSDPISSYGNDYQTQMGNPEFSAGAYTEDGNTYVRYDQYGDPFYYPKSWADKGIWVEFRNKQGAESAHGMSEDQIKGLVTSGKATLMAGAKQLGINRSQLGAKPPADNESQSVLGGSGSQTGSQQSQPSFLGPSVDQPPPGAPPGTPRDDWYQFEGPKRSPRKRKTSVVGQQ